MDSYPYILILQVESTTQGSNSKKIRDSVDTAVKQVKRSRGVFQFIMPDLSCSSSVTLVVALPFVTKQQLETVGLSVCLSVNKRCTCSKIRYFKYTQHEYFT